MSRTIQRLIFISAFLLLAYSSAGTAERASKSLPVRIAVVSKSVLDLPFWVARERKFFFDEGLEVEIVFIALM